MERPPRSKLTIASSSRSRCTGTPRTVPDAAQATAASSNSCGGSPSPWMQLRRAAPPRGASSLSFSSTATRRNPIHLPHCLHIHHEAESRHPRDH
eukprot:scaffold40398_cov54-Phaeocystis_antarctica.AAC.2